MEAVDNSFLFGLAVEDTGQFCHDHHPERQHQPGVNGVGKALIDNANNQDPRPSQKCDPAGCHALHNFPLIAGPLAPDKTPKNREADDEAGDDAHEHEWRHEEIQGIAKKNQEHDEEERHDDFQGGGSVVHRLADRKNILDGFFEKFGDFEGEKN